MVYLYRRDGKAALESANRGVQLAAQHGFAFLSAWSFYLRAWTFSVLQDEENARLDIQQALAASHPESCTTASFLGLFLAECYWHLQEAEQGLAILAKPPREHSYDVERLRLQAEFNLLRFADADTIEQTSKLALETEGLFRQALALSNQQGTRSYTLRIAVGWSKLLENQHRYSELILCLTMLISRLMKVLLS